MYTNEFPTPNLHEVLQSIFDNQHTGWLPSFVSHTTIGHAPNRTELTLDLSSATGSDIYVRLAAHGESTRLAYRVGTYYDRLTEYARGEFDLNNLDNHAAARQITGVFLRGMVSPQRKEGAAVTEIHAADIAARIKDAWGDENTKLHTDTEDRAAIDFHEDGDGARLVIITVNSEDVPWYYYEITPIHHTLGNPTPLLYRAGSITTQGEYDGLVGTDNQDGEIDLILDELSRRWSDRRTVEEKLNTAMAHSYNLVSMKQGH